MMKWLKRLLYLVIVLVIAAAAAWLFGPREPRDTTLRFDPASIGDDVDAYLAAEEARFDDIRDGLQKQVVWAFPESRARTRLAIVYVHGYSASSGEIRPVPDLVAQHFGANLFYTRLTGHGRTGDAMLDGSVNAWVNDVAEALAIGRRIGEHVIVIATSTGGSLAAWAATQPAMMEDVTGMVLISPNFAVKNSSAFVLSLPWGGTIAELVAGPERSFETINDQHAALWTWKYPTQALLPMKAAVDMARDQRYSAVTLPALFIFDPADEVVDESVTQAIMERWGGSTSQYTPTGTDDPYHHVIAGDALSPSTTGPTAEAIIQWIGALGFRPAKD